MKKLTKIHKKHISEWHKKNKNTLKYKERSKKLSKKLKGRKNPLIREKLKIWFSKKENKLKIQNSKKKTVKTRKERYKIWHTKKTKEKIGLGNKGKGGNYRKGLNYEKIFGKKKAKQIIKNWKEKRKTWIIPKKDTIIEVKIQNFLKQLNIEFFTHQHINIKHGYQCDIFIPSLNMVIECDGVYWHKYPVGNDIDNIRNKELKEKGFRVLRLWESEIKILDLNKFKEKLKNVKPISL